MAKVRTRKLNLSALTPLASLPGLAVASLSGITSTLCRLCDFRNQQERSQQRAGPRTARARLGLAEVELTGVPLPAEEPILCAHARALRRTSVSWLLPPF